jgi:hypothetical protein
MVAVGSAAESHTVVPFTAQIAEGGWVNGCYRYEIRSCQLLAVSRLTLAPQMQPQQCESETDGWRRACQIVGRAAENAWKTLRKGRGSPLLSLGPRVTDRKCRRLQYAYRVAPVGCY